MERYQKYKVVSVMSEPPDAYPSIALGVFKFPSVLH